MQRAFRRVFFSFHYGEDSVNAAQIRNSNVIAGVGKAGFADGAEWETVRRNNEQTIRNWINDQLEGTSVTVVLIGSNTAGRRWVNYEITQSVAKGNGLLGIYMHLMDGFQPAGSGLLNFIAPQPGRSPFLGHPPRMNLGGLLRLAGVPPSLDGQVTKYCWVMNRGRDNLGAWIEDAARDVGR